MILSNLNDPQKEAVTFDGNALITACPGSGKTRVLTRRVAYEIYERINNSKQLVAALTFTNRAASELEHRLDRLNIQPRQLWAGTIHSFCLEWILRPYAGYSKNLKNGFIVVDNYYSEEELKKLKKKYDIPVKYSISTRITKDRKFEDINYDIPNYQDNPYYKVLIEYYTNLSKNRQINFDLILYLAYKLLEDYPRIAKNLSKIFTLICVDEYQDTQELQYEIIHMILRAGEGETSIFYVGDTNQAIYDSLGGIAKPKEQIERETGLTLTNLNLPGNYRSTQKIVDYYSSFQVDELTITAEGQYRDDPSEITYSKEVYYESVAEYICDLIKKAINEQGIDPTEICVLAPQWYPLAHMGRKLNALLPEIPFDAPGLSPIRKDIENIWYKMARLVLSEPHPRYFLIRMRWARQIIEDLRSHVGTVIPHQYESPKGLLRLVNSISIQEDDGLEYLRATFTEITNALNFLVEDYPGLQNNWDSFFDGAQSRIDDERNNYPSDTNAFRKLFKSKKGVVINTCQGVKGEEFECVIAFSLLDGKVPHWTVNRWRPEESEPSSKRMMYVIGSRAKRFLHLISETGRPKGDLPTPVLGALEYEYDDLTLE